MRIVSLEPYLTELVLAYGMGSSLVGVSHRCVVPPEVTVPRLTAPGASKENGALKLLHDNQVDLNQLRSLTPDVILTKLSCSRQAEREQLPICKRALDEFLGVRTGLYAHDPFSLETVYQMFRAVGSEIKAPEKGIALEQRLKAQLMDWVDNFYPRMKSKKVSFIESLDPLTISGFWIADMIHLASCVSQNGSGLEPKIIEWQEVVDFRPDVIIVAPSALDLKQTLKTFAPLEKYPHWEEIPAVKRGEVIFASGAEFALPGPRLVDAAGTLISALAGLESGYITPRDSFHRLRWLELHRHTL